LEETNETMQSNGWRLEMNIQVTPQPKIQFWKKRKIHVLFENIHTKSSISEQAHIFQYV
jgi:hypothetical protein